tara:strand:- start:52 stop:342 length:291 start_codon:yes stop_codon:yes gene_type:complete
VEPGAGIEIGGFEGSGAGISVELGDTGKPADLTRGVLLSFGGRLAGFGLATGFDNREELFLIFFEVLRRPLAGFALSVDCWSPANNKVATNNKING